MFHVHAPADACQPGACQAPPREQELGVERRGVLGVHGPVAVVQATVKDSWTGHMRAPCCWRRRERGATPTRPSWRADGVDDVEGRDEHADEHHGDEQAVDAAGEVYGTEAAAAEAAEAGFHNAAETPGTGNVVVVHEVDQSANAGGEGVRLSGSARRPRKVDRSRSTGAQAGEIASISCIRSV